MHRAAYQSSGNFVLVTFRRAQGTNKLRILLSTHCRNDMDCMPVQDRAVLNELRDANET